jgi:alkanesulfonate monooxygenase SsuD/methylene tetrahydromethanopterin reductase-like flavin-dependent oxidoreductase (luciferase family)
MAAFGRPADALKILLSLSVVVGETAQAAEDKYQALQDLTHISVSLRFLSGDLETDLSDLPLDEPVPEHRIPKSSNLHQKFWAEIVETIRRDKPTLRQLATGYSRGRTTFRGTATQIADLMEEWFCGGATDGFMMSFQVQPTGLDDFCAKVVPELQRRGLFRTEYTGTTLREHLGLPRPANRHVAARQAAE